MLTLPMPRKTRKPWNAGKNLFPELRGGQHPPPRPLGDAPLVGHSTAPHMPARWRIERVAADGTRKLVRVGERPWEGSEQASRVEADRLQRGEPGCRFELIEKGKV